MAAIITPLSSQTNPTNHHPFKAWSVCIAASLFFFYEFIQMMMFNSINTDLMAAFPNLTPAGLGNLSAMYFYANAIFLLPAAFLLDRISTKKLVLSATLFCAASVFGFSQSHSLLFSQVCRFTEGMGAAFVMLSCMRLASRWFPTHRLALVTGIIITIAMSGGVVAQTPLILLKNFYGGVDGWRHALVWDACLGVLISAIIFMLVEDFPPNYEKEKVAQKNHTKSLGLLKSFKMTWGKLPNWFSAIYAASLNLPIYLLGAIWGVMFLTGKHDFNQTEASYATSMLFVGSIVGGPIIGWCSDALGRRRIPMILCAVASLITIVVISILPTTSSISLMIVLFFILGFFTSAQVLSYPLVSEMNPIALNSTAISIISSVIMLSGAFGQPLFGWLMSFSGGTSQSHYDFTLAMRLMPIMFVISIILTLFLPETFCKRKADTL